MDYPHGDNKPVCGQKSYLEWAESRAWEISWETADETADGLESHPTTAPLQSTAYEPDRHTQSTVTTQTQPKHVCVCKSEVTYGLFKAHGGVLRSFSQSIS